MIRGSGPRDREFKEDHISWPSNTSRPAHHLLLTELWYSTIGPSWIEISRRFQKLERNSRESGIWLSESEMNEL